MHVLEQRAFDLRRISKTIEEIAFGMWSVTGGGGKHRCAPCRRRVCCGLPGQYGTILEPVCAFGGQAGEDAGGVIAVMTVITDEEP
jgi:hypothetical protein